MMYFCTNLLFMLGLIGLPGGTEIFVILFIVLLLFGGKKIPELMRGLGKGIREFNTAKDTISRELEEGMREPTQNENSAEKVN